MHRGVFHALTRRASLLTIGAALSDPVASDAKKRRRKKKGKNGDVFKFRKKQADQCLDFFLPLCGDDLICQATVETCCPEVGQCDFTGFIVCLDDAQATVELAGPLFRRP